MNKKYISQRIKVARIDNENIMAFSTMNIYSTEVDGASALGKGNGFTAGDEEENSNSHAAPTSVWDE